MAQGTIQETFDLAFGHHQAGRLPEAELLYVEILVREPEHLGALRNLALVAHQLGRNEIAVELIRRAVAVMPNDAEIHSDLGIALKHAGQLDEAIAEYRHSIALGPGNADAHNNLGNALNQKGRLDEAIDAYRQAIALRPDFAGAYKNLGFSLSDKGQLDESIAAYRQAVLFKPDYAEAFNNLGNALKDTGRLDEAIGAYRQAIALNPGYVDAHSNLVFAMHYHSGYDVKAIAEENRRWYRQHAEPLRKCVRAHGNERSFNRRLRIGYVSPDFREHPVARFLLPLLANHDKSQVEVFAYAQVVSPDAMTGRLRSCTDGWRNILGLSDDQAADLIRGDQIDILVDLTMHTAGNRLLMFARKPAPIQVSYLAYCSSTGLETIDYRLSDPNLDPPGGESFYSERTILLPKTYWCYQPIEHSPEVSPLPALAKGVITFGCLNNFCKISEKTLGAWAKLLRAVLNSQLLLITQEGSHRGRTHEFMEREGIESGRVRFARRTPLRDYLALYHGIDIALDTFPYAGGTTTCDGLWMGVPTVSLVGKTAVGRGGSSILSNIGAPELIARSEEEYVRIACGLAGDLPRLAELRRTLRPRMQASALMDGGGFARDIEAAYRQMWRAWCETPV